MSFGEITAAVQAAGPAFARVATVMREAASAMGKFGDVWYRTAERAYLQHHTRLPGGKRTARLRKKRRTQVLMWFSEFIAAH